MSTPTMHDQEPFAMPNLPPERPKVWKSYLLGVIIAPAGIILALVQASKAHKLGISRARYLSAAGVLAVAWIALTGIIIGTSGGAASYQAPAAAPAASAPAAAPATSAPAAAPATTAPAPVATTAPATSAPAAPAISTAEQQAVDSAQSYLAMGQGFSKAGLFNQLTSSAGEGFSAADANFAINYLKPDWNAQAVESAKGYLAMGGFSRASLIEQLTSSSGEGFTEAQAEYAVAKVGL